MSFVSPRIVAYAHAVSRLFATKWRLSLGCVGLLLVTAEAAHAQEAVDFSREVQPLIARRCLQCHGPDTAEGGLSFIDQASALAELDSGDHAIVPGDVEASVLLERVTTDDEGMRMPPEGKPLTEEEVDVLRRWIAAGATWEQHWGFQPPKPRTPPEVENKDWVRTPIDAFILSKLEAASLQPAPPANKIALLRRAYYDLTGLPPTPAEVQAFLEDASPDAFEKVIDRLLASPQYGERWARHWLDLVRYGETNSFERDGAKPHVWRYRDYVIRSFNEDKPYDQFVREQLAGDELPEPTADSIIATGYYRLGLWDDEPADRLLATYDQFDDLVATTGQAFLALTTGCARCHDHKIDPFPASDYYGFLAFFRGIAPYANSGPQVETQIFLDGQTPEQYQAQVKALEEKRNQLQAQVTEIEQQFQQAYQQRYGDQLSMSDLDELTFRFYRDSWQKLPDFDNLHPETVGRVPSQRFDISLATRNTAFGFVFDGFIKVPQDGEYTFYLDSDDGSRLTIGQEVVIEYDGIHGLGREKQQTLTLQQGRLPIRLEYFQNLHGLGLKVAWSGPGFGRRSLAAENTPRAAQQRAQQLAKLMKEHGRELLGEEGARRYHELAKQLEQAKAERVPATYALSVTEAGPKPPVTHVLLRGNPHVPGEVVEPTFPSVLTEEQPVIPPPAPGAKSSGRRLALANWIASPDNPMTARVMVNRIWQHHFGRGIVRSTNNFGGLGTPPTHPELLDWLALEFVNRGWRMKELHRLIMLSSAYQMSSQGDDVALQKDPTNDLFWRFDMRRLSAEEIRDSIHAVNGQLNLKMYGPSIYPDLSDEVLQTQSKPGDGWGKSSLAERSRRSIYIHIKRSLLVPLLTDFDLPDPDSSCEARFITTQPGQALGMLNGDFVHEQAAFFAERLRKEAGHDTEAQVRHALRLALSREPEAKDVARGLELIAALQKEHQVAPDKALDYYCLVVLNLNEFIYLD